ncbi:MAG: hypothetical protein HC773_00975 [Scytonema sp. CRU_2_7]|nr:hypothetical protein [Scytonema sp. CRU_2_7]
MGSRPKTLAEIKFQEQLTEYISIIKEQAKADQLLGSREAFLENSIDYSKNFLERIERYGVTELGEKLTLLNWNKEHLLGVSDTRIYSVATTGNAQCGKTLQNTLFLIDFTLFSNLDTIWFYPTKTIMDSLVPNMFGRLSTEYLANLNKHLGLDIKTDRKSNTNCSFRQANIYFRYASTSAQEHTDKRRGLATVGGSAASISGNVLFIEERSQISPDAVSTLYRRLDAARLPGGLVREIGTPGNGLGIEIQEKDADHHFYPHVTCPNCQADIKLSPKGCLLKVQPNGKYLSASGRPVSWYHSDPENPIESAYFACTNCGICLGGEARKLAFLNARKKE